MKMYRKNILKMEQHKNNILRFFENIFVLKNLYRQGWIRYYGTKESETESVADHIFSVAVLSYIFAREYRNDLDADKVLRLALFHEFGEVYAGDITLSSIKTDKDAQEKEQKERESVEKVFSGIMYGAEYQAFWEEFEQQTSAEAKFVKQMDKLEFVLQGYNYARAGVGEMDVKGFVERTSKYISDKKLQAVLEEVLQTDLKK